MDFKITITDETHLFAIDRMVEERNASMKEDEEPFTQESYLQFIVDKAGESWAKNFPMVDKAAYSAAIGELDKAKLTASGDFLTKIEQTQKNLIEIKLGK